MRLRPWVKMGLKIIKSAVLVAVIFNICDNSLNNSNELEKYTLDKSFSLIASASKEWEDINKDPYATKGTLYGDLTGYSADCPMCGGTLGCKPSYNVYKNGVVTYPDKTYGNVRIVASSKSLKCGSVVRFNSSRVSSNTTYAIVLDRGVLGNDLDLLVESESYAAKNIGRSKIKYEVVRYGW